MDGATSFPGGDPHCRLGVAPLARPLLHTAPAFREAETSSKREGRSEGRVMDYPPLATRGREGRVGSKIVAGHRHREKQQATYRLMRE